MRRLRGAPKRRRKFPRILLAVTADDERRLAMLHLTKERFVVDECAVGSDVLRMWEHPCKYDAVLVLLDEELDPTCPLVVSDIRRCELDKDAQQRADKTVTRVARVGEAEVEKVAVHRAQRFAERQKQKQDLVSMQAALSDPMPPVGPKDHPVSSLVLQTVIIGFCEPGNTTKHRAMANSGNYDFVEFGKPSDAANMQWLVGQLRAEYALPTLDALPTFEDVVANLKAFRDDVSAPGNEHNAMEKMPISPQSPHAERWRHSGTHRASTAHGLDASTTVLSLERQLREAKAKVEELTAARDATEMDLSNTQHENQRLRTELEDVREKFAVADDLRCSFQERYESRVVELHELRKEVDIQLRQLKGGQHGQLQLNADVQHLVAQNNRLRDTAFAFETALHEATAQCKILQRKVERGIAGKRQSSVPRGCNSGVLRHQSLARLALPAADEIFKHNAEEVGPHQEVKFGEELHSDSSASNGENDDVVEQRHPPRRLAASFVKKSARNLNAHRGHGTGGSHALALACSTLEAQEAALMAFHDFGSAEREFFDGCGAWMRGDGARRRIALQHALHPAMGHATLKFECGTLLQAWGAAEQEFRSANALRKELQTSTPVELVFRHADGSQLEAMRAFLIDDGLSNLSAEELLNNLNQTCGPLAALMDRSSSSYRKLFAEMLADQLRLYDKVATRLPTLVETPHLESALSVLNLLTVQACASVKAAVVTFSALERQNDKSLRDTIIAAAVSFAQIVNPMKHLLQSAALRGEAIRRFDFATQTDVAQVGKRDGLVPRPPRMAT